MSDAALAVGDRFTMKADAKPVEIRDKSGSLLVRFLPGFSYRATGKNLDVANKMLAAGACLKGGLELGERLAKAGIAIGAPKADVSASVTVKPKRKRKS